MIPPDDTAGMAERDYLRSLPRRNHQRYMVNRAMALVTAEIAVGPRELSSEEWSAVRAGVEWAVTAWGDWMIQADYLFLPAELVTGEQARFVWGPIRPAFDQALMGDDDEDDDAAADDGHGD